jgi:hypothetical protein
MAVAHKALSADAFVTTHNVHAVGIGATRVAGAFVHVRTIITATTVSFVARTDVTGGLEVCACCVLVTGRDGFALAKFDTSETVATITLVALACIRAVRVCARSMETTWTLQALVNVETVAVFKRIARWAHSVDARLGVVAFVALSAVRQVYGLEA